MGRPGRPDGLTRAVLEAPLRMAVPGWGSRAVAEHVGTSQSAVARVWAETYAEAAHPIAAYDLRVVGVEVAADCCVVVLTGRRAEAPLPLAGFMRSPRRAALQTLLAADLVRGGAPDAVVPPESVDRVRALVDATPAGRRTFVLTRTALADPGAAEQVVVDDDGAWQRLLGPLVVATAHTPTAELVALQLRLMEWARTGRGRLVWVPDEPRAAEPAPAPGTPRPVSHEIARQAFAHILGRVASGQLGAGDRVTEASLARGLRTSRGYVREALRALAADGLVELEPRRGAVVPVPRVRDVIDTYSARRALGSLLVQRAATTPQRDLEPAERALAEMVALAEAGDARATGDADLRFQDALAGATSMRHVPDMFRTLTSQVLLYTTVMGLAYVYSIPHMVRDDAAILKAVRLRDEDLAVRLWQAKIDAALDHMATRL